MNKRLTQEEFVRLAKKGKIKVKALLFKKGHHMDRHQQKAVQCSIGEYHISGFRYKVNLVHEESEYELRDIYTCDLISLINNGIFEAIIEEEE